MIMKKFFENWYLNAIVAVVAVVGVVFQESSIGTGFWGMLGIGLAAAAGGSLLGEVVKIIGVQRDFNVWDLLTGCGIGGAVCLMLALIF